MSGFSYFGVNISGAEYGAGGNRGIGHDYIYPTHAQIDYFASKGMTAIRLPFLLERVQPISAGPLNVSELGYIDDIVSYAATKGIDVILDPHNFGAAHGIQIGSTAASNAAFADFWGKFADHFSSTSNVLFGLMNEPNTVSAAQWIVSVNAAISAIRAAGATSQQILIPGTYWDSAENWTSSDNARIVGAGVVDPSHNFAFEVHQYLDYDGTGSHDSVVSSTIGIDRISAITAWAESTDNKIFLGEFGVASDATSLAALNNMLGYMAQHTDVWQGGTYWAAGAWWGPYMYSLEPTNKVDKPQMAVLESYIQDAIESLGSTSLVQFANNYYLDSTSSGSGPLLKYGGEAVGVGQFAPYVPIGAEQISNGYDVVWKASAADQYTIWSVDNNGHFISNGPGVLPGNSSALQSFETSFRQDLNGDGMVGVPPALEIAPAITSDGRSDAARFELPTDAGDNNAYDLILRTSVGGGGHPLIGGGGNDYLVGAAGADTFIGGAGSDTVSYYFAAAGVTASLAAPANNTGEASGDTCSGVENIFGSVYNDSLAGNSSPNRLKGGNGNDALIGGLGSDVLSGGEGNDTFVFHPGEASGDIITDFVGNGASLGDQLRFEGFGAGATFTSIDDTHWQVNHDGDHEIITFSSAVSINLGDYFFV